MQAARSGARRLPSVVSSLSKSRTHPDVSGDDRPGETRTSSQEENKNSVKSTIQLMG